MIMWIAMAVGSVSMAGFGLTKETKCLATMKAHVAFGVTMSCILFAPFAWFLATGFSWSGHTPTQEQALNIQKRHMPLAVSWFALSLVQMLTVKRPSIHVNVGKLLNFVVLPCWFLELATNAVFVFLPDKPWYLALTVFHDGEPSAVPTWLQVLASCGPFLPGLTVAPTLLMHWIMSLQNLYPKKGQSRNIRLHYYHMICFAMVALGAGLVRFHAQLAFRISGCPMHQDPIISIYTQGISFPWYRVAEVVWMTFMVMTVPLSLRNWNPSIHRIYIFNVATAVIACLSAGAFGLPFIPRCS